jgi:hypothetical protein
MRKALIIILSVLVLGGGAFYAVHAHSRDAAIFAARHDYSQALDQSTGAYLQGFNAAIFQARSERDQADAAYDITIRNAQIAHDEAVAKVASLTDNDPAKVEAVRKADVELQMSTALANARHHIAVDNIDARYQEAKQRIEAAKARAVADADAKYDAATKNSK